ncbi:unnamed protein product [Notodromas monacha]|uniref:Uncharacterized protein n=1 Tax=Notodromas monacha TaxID=399045 RepID=A0A7R9BW53_9CRUS|nr:unnamed protein product [Notodromas monacha]CAG0921509.1 unnamed protein product [Notodromas monacha]
MSRKEDEISQADAEANSGGFPFEAQPAFRPDNIDGVDYWVLTAYFVDPAQVCVGRTSEEFDEFGTGTGLFIVTGPGAMDYDAIPSKQEDAELSEWVYGRCFVSMGEWTIVGTQQWLFGAPRCPKAVIAPDTFKYARERRLPKTPASSGDHFWYRVSPDLDCNEFFPAFLLYNQGELTGFGWAVQGIYESDHVEYPPSFVLNLFMNPVPTCLPGLVDTIGVTTQHIYFNADLFNVIC